MNRSLRRTSFLAIPFTSYFTKSAPGEATRVMSTMTPNESGSLGSLVVNVAEKLGIGEYVNKRLGATLLLNIIL